MKESYSCWRLTWDVFKFALDSVGFFVTYCWRLTWDVFKSFNYRIICQRPTSWRLTWDVFKCRVLLGKGSYKLVED